MYGFSAIRMNAFFSRAATLSAAAGLSNAM
jgi:hypothetical protein